MGQNSKRSFLLTLLLPIFGFCDTGFKDTIRVTEIDGAPTCMAGQLKVTNGTLTCSGQVATVTTGGGGGGSGSSTLAVQAGAVLVSSPTANIIFNSQGFTSKLGATTTAYINLNPATTDFIHNQSSLQSSTFHVSSGAVEGQLSILTPRMDFIWLSNVNNPNGTFWAKSTSGISPQKFELDWSYLNDGTTNLTLLMSNTNNVGSGVQEVSGWNFEDSARAIQATIADTGIIKAAAGITAFGTLSGSGPGGIVSTYGISAGSGTFTKVQVSSNSILANTTFYQDGTVIIGSRTTPSAANDFILQVSSANGITLFGIQQNSHVISSGTIPSVSSCGTSPSMDGNATDFAGTINTGSASPTACTLTFANPFATIPTCVVSDDLQTAEPAITSRSTTAITITLGAALNSGHLFFICVGKQ